MVSATLKFTRSDWPETNSKTCDLDFVEHQKKTISLHYILPRTTSIALALSSCTELESPSGRFSLLNPACIANMDAKLSSIHMHLWIRC